MVTTVPTITASQFASRMAALVPRGWAGDAAKQPGGVLYSLLLSLGGELNYVLAQLQYDLAACYIQTETSPELDLASMDFFGDALPRPVGATDAQFLALIQAALFPPGATRIAVQNAIFKLTGIEPRIVEPWNPGDTGTWGTGYWDIDTRETPSEWAGTGDRYQGFIESILPPIANLGNNNPLLCYDVNSYWDENGYFQDVTVTSGIDQLYAVINAVRPFGTIAWVKIVSTPPL